jgi:hypothetical protein
MIHILLVERNVNMMYQETTIQITFRHPVRYTEVLPDDVESTEAVLESGLALPLIELYGGMGEVIIEKVTAETDPKLYSYEDAVCYHSV